MGQGPEAKALVVPGDGEPRPEEGGTWLRIHPCLPSPNGQSNGRCCPSCLALQALVGRRVGKTAPEPGQYGVGRGQPRLLQSLPPGLAFRVSCANRFLFSRHYASPTPVSAEPSIPSITPNVVPSRKEDAAKHNVGTVPRWGLPAPLLLRAK